MYVCQCDPSKDDALEAVGSFRQVEVDGEGICNECGYYALFTTTFQGSAMRGMFDSQGCTIFTSNKLFTYFENIRHIESKYQLYKIRKGLSENGYYNGKNYTVILGHKNELPEELRVFSVFLEIVNAENTRKSFRSVAILWGAMLDETLNDLLLTYKKLNPETNVKANTLNNKIDRTFQFQLITDQQKDRLDHIRLIRNEVAHNWNLTLENEKFNYSLKTLYFLDHSENFEYLENLDFLLQMIFSGSCAMIVLELKNRIETFINEL